MSNTKINEKLELKQILDLFTSGCKPENEHKIGIEYERLPIFSVTKRAADYYSEFGICNFLREFAREDNWDYITDDYNIIGLKQGHDTITLEPGSQFEMSLKPEVRISDIEKKIYLLDKKMKPILNKSGIELLKYGISPVSTHKNIKLIPKKRYHIMAKYLWGILSDVMMRESAGIQVCFDFSSEEDAIRKYQIANKLSPFMTAMFANSPIRGGVDTGYKTFRALSWLNTDNDRCGFAGNMSNKFSFEEYISYVLKSPMIFINKENFPVEINGKINFETYMQNGWKGFFSDIDDFILHSNLYFPEIRLRNFIEIRNHDCVNHGLQFAILAIYKGILYNKTAMDEIEDLFSIFEYKDFAEFRYNVPKNALNCKIRNFEVSEIAKDILYIAEKALLENNEGEEKYLNTIKELTMRNLSPADIILKNWYGIWNKDINKLIKYVAS